MYMDGTYIMQGKQSRPSKIRFALLRSSRGSGVPTSPGHLTSKAPRARWMAATRGALIIRSPPSWLGKARVCVCSECGYEWTVLWRLLALAIERGFTPSISGYARRLREAQRKNVIN